MADNYIRFRSASSFTLQVNGNIKTWNGTIEYSNNASSWSTWDGVSVLSSGGTNNYLYLRGTGNTYITGEDYYYDNYWVLTGSEIYCEYNIENLLDYATVAAGNHPSAIKYCFAGLFYDCTALVQAPEILITDFSPHAIFRYMFTGCTSLLYPPSSLLAVDAGTFASCDGMFYGCTSLLYTPTFPNLVYVGSYSFYEMFSGCTSLTTLPDLPATSFNYNAGYAYMFEGCTSIKVSQAQTGAYTKPWRLPPTGTATQGQYTHTDGMLSGTGGSFTGDPQLNTTYYQLESPKLTFSSDAGFNIKTIRAGWNGTIEYSKDGNNWSTWGGGIITSGSDNKIYLRGIGNTIVSNGIINRIVFTVTSGHTVQCDGLLDSLLDYQSIINGQDPPMIDRAFYCLFYSASVLTKAPTFPNRQLTQQCYLETFWESGLTEMPDLPSTQLAVGCYQNMFVRCPNLTATKELPATTLAKQCYDGMFYGSNALTYVAPIRAQILAESCCDSMFQGCTSLAEAPTLLATQLTKNCYQNMFYGCTSLVRSPNILATSGGYYSCYSMFEGCTSLKIPSLIHMLTYDNSTCYFMYRGCSSLKLSTTQTGCYTKPYRIPNEGQGIEPSQWYYQPLQFMFYETGGTFAGTPTLNTTYYLWETPHITFMSNSSFTLSIYNSTKNWDGTLQYSTDELNWTAWDGTTTLSSNEGYMLFLRGVGNTKVTGDYNRGFRLSGSNISCSGTIESLLDCTVLEQGSHPTMGWGAFYDLFKQQTALVSAPELTSITLSDYCYRSMFYKCTGLTQAPLIPSGATFGDCSCWYMFCDCTSLNSLPNYNFTNLYSSCFENMFSGCNSLTDISNVTLGQIANYACAEMFDSCSSLVNTPVFSDSSTVGYYGCYSMFYNCQSLQQVTNNILPATTLNTHSYDDMFKYSGITKVPQICATTLIGYECHCDSMFWGCTRLTEMQYPLLFTSFSRGTCQYMFYGCTALQSVPEFQDNISSVGVIAFYSMFEGCTSLTNAPKLPCTNISETCYSDMFRGCTSLTKPVDLPATNLPRQCYEGMFYGCVNIALYRTSTILGKEYRIPIIGSGAVGTDSMTNMFTNTGGDNIGTPEINTTYYRPAMVTVSAQYGDETIFSYNQMSDQLYNRIIYDDEVKSADNWMGTKTFNTINTIMSSHLIVGLKALLCSNKVMDKNITITSTLAS